MSHRPFKDRLYAEFARIGSALASERRLEFIDLLAQGPRRVDALAAEAGLSIANASQHLQVLRHARLVESERSGTSVIYRLADDSVLRLWLSLREVGEARLAEIPELRRTYGLDPPDGVALESIPGLLQGGQALLLDVRPRSEFEHGHVPGAISVPIEELPNRLEELPRDRRIVAYCRGRYCLFADDAVELLRNHGFDAVRLDDGWIEWHAGRLKSEPHGAPSATA